ncbi:hypothetical protein PCE1_004347 [Barthelona sp. PCE]
METRFAHGENSQLEHINRNDFFERFFGFTESVKSVKENVAVSKEGDTIHMECPAGIYQVGELSIKSISDLKEIVDAIEPSEENGTISILMGNGVDTKNFEEIDVGGQQGQVSNKGATFQVASNFNALEFVSPNDNASMGITRYVWDRTQGPAASISCAPSTLYRNYFHEHDGHVGQLDTEINLLDDYNIPVQHGYVVLNRRNVDEKMQLRNNWQTIKVGCQRDTQVVTGLDSRGLLRVIPITQEQVVNQIFCASVNMNIMPVSWRKNPVLPLVRDLLMAAYHGAVYNAIINKHRNPDLPGSHKLFLTLVGGGVFSNPLKEIIGAIKEVKPLILKYGIEAKIVLFSGPMNKAVAIQRELGCEIEIIE